MSGTLVFGYDVEMASQDSVGFLDGAGEVHERFGVPWTIYLTGETVEKCTDAIRACMRSPLVTVAQHTYSHVLLKSVYMTPGDGRPVHGAAPNFFKAGGTLEQIGAEISNAQRVIKELLEVDCQGLTGPWGYYRGLVDRPDILQILRDNGIRWVRTNARDYRDCQPTPFSEQPFFFRDQGFPEILELGIQGYQDRFYWDRFDDRSHGDSYQDYLFAMVEETARNGWIWNLCSHDHGTATKREFAERCGWIADLIVRAREAGLRFAAAPEIYADLNAGAPVDGGRKLSRPEDDALTVGRYDGSV